MKLIKSSFEILEQGPGIEGIYKQIELAGRTCYKSLDKITEDSAKGFVDRMIKSQHYAMLEHGTVYLRVPWGTHLWKKYSENPYSEVFEVLRNNANYITTNLRVLIENSWLDDLQYLCEPTEYHEKRVTVRFTTDRGVSHEFVRHRVFSFAQESTRYCNYSKDKFGNELTFIIPSWSKLIAEGSYDLRTIWDISNEPSEDRTFAVCCYVTEDNYLHLLQHHNLSPQQARQVLPNALKTELVMTGFVSDWNHFFDLRARGTTGAPHPDAKALAEPLMYEFKNRMLI